MALRDQPYIPLYIQDFLTDEKLIEELSLEYESFIETDVRENETTAVALARELAKGALLAGTSAVLNKALPFLR